MIHIPSTFLSKWDSCLASSDFNWDTVNVLWKQRKHYKLNHVEFTWAIDAMWLVLHHYHDIRQLIKQSLTRCVGSSALICLAVPTSEPHYSKKAISWSWGWAELHQGKKRKVEDRTNTVYNQQIVTVCVTLKRKANMLKPSKGYKKSFNLILLASDVKFY